MELAVEVVLTGSFEPVYSTGNLEDAGFSWLQVESEARTSGWSVPTAGGIPGSRSADSLRYFRGNSYLLGSN